jgi:hypothetical protein
VTTARPRRVRVSRRQIIAVGVAIVLGVCAVLAVLETAGGSGSAGLNGNLYGGVMASVPVRTNEVALYTGLLQNKSGHTVILDAATLLPLANFHLPGRLQHVGVETGREFAGAAAGWPPPRKLGFVPLTGYRLTSGHRIKILYGVSAAAPGDYVTKGLRMTVEVAGSQESVIVLSGSLTCVEASAQLVSCPSALYARAQQAVRGEP